MRWLYRISQRFEDTQFWGKQFLQQNPGYSPQMDVYQSPDFPHVFLGGENDLKEAEALAGQPMCEIVDCRDLPEISEGVSWDYPTYLAIKEQFDVKVEDLVQKITSIDCPIFVHCALGANRSVAVLAAALVKLTNKPLNDVLSGMKQTRSFVSPQDPLYLMALDHSPADSPPFKKQRFDALDQESLINQDIPVQASGQMINDLEMIDEERQWIRAVSTPGFTVRHDDGWTGKVVQLHGDPVNGGKVLVEHSLDRMVVQRLYPALELSPAMTTVSPFRRASKNWLQKIALPIKITPEMDDFADRCIKILFEGNVSYDEAFNEEHLLFDDRYIPIAVMLKKPEASKGLATTTTPTWWDLSNLSYGESLAACYIDLYESIPPRNTPRELKKAILHELVHSVDPKLNDPNLFDADWHKKHRKDISFPEYIDSPKHYNAPWEQDAFMSSEAHDQVSMWKRNGVSLERALQELRNHMADNPREREWKNSPDLWRRYMQTLARTVQEMYQI